MKKIKNRREGYWINPSVRDRYGTGPKLFTSLQKIISLTTFQNVDEYILMIYYSLNEL